MNALTVIALNGFREARRNRVTLLSAAFAAALLFLGVLLADTAYVIFDRVLHDVGLGLMSIMLVVLAIFLGASAVPDDLERRSMFLVVTRPVSRTTYLLGRAAGNVLTLWVVLATMVGIFMLECLATGTPVRQAVGPAVLGLAVELVVLTAFTFLFTSFSSKVVAATCTAGVYFAGHFASDIYRSAQKSAPSVQALAKAVYYGLPNFENIDFRNHAAHDLQVQWAALGQGAIQAGAYGLLVLVVATVIIERRDFK